MILSFFSHTDFVTGVDYSSHPDCIHQEDIEIDIGTQIPVLIENDGEYSIEIQDKPPTPETPEEKKARIANLLIISEKYEEVDREGVTFDKRDIGPMIISRFFGGDPNSEMAYLQRWNYLKDIERTEVEEIELELIKSGYLAKEAFKNFILSLS